MPYTEQQPGLIERIAAMLKILPNAENRIPTFNKTDNSLYSLLDPTSKVEAGIMPTQYAYNPNISTTPDQIIREGVNKHTSGDYKTALNYFLRAKNMSGKKDENLEDYIFRTQRLIEEMQKRGIE